jgi:hydrogenase nickel incorporation protein HypB
MGRFREGVEILNEGVTTFPLSCRTGEGVAAWIDWISGEPGNRDSQE